MNSAAPHLSIQINFYSLHNASGHELFKVTFCDLLHACSVPLANKTFSYPPSHQRSPLDHIIFRENT
uniref:Uncharacterized protein n=1 Tax=Arundo donax TaxID=35708 RepID=A0A0A9E2K0_ARUDO